MLDALNVARRKLFKLFTQLSGRQRLSPLYADLFSDLMRAHSLTMSCLSLHHSTLVPRQTQRWVARAETMILALRSEKAPGGAIGPGRAVQMYEREGFQQHLIFE